MRTPRAFSLCLAALVISLTSIPAIAQRADALPRINAPLDESVRTRLNGNISALARPQFDQGQADSSVELSHMRLLLSRTAEQKAALDKYLADLQDKSSPNYHKWITPDEFGLRYGPGDADIAALTSWLGSHGLKLETVSKGRTDIAFSGTVTQVQEAFHTPIHSFLANGEQFYSNTRDPQIPSALATVVSGIGQLNTIRPKSYAARAKSGMLNPQTNRLEPQRSGSKKSLAPEFTVGSAADGYFLYIVPGDAATIYDTPNTKFNANYTTGTSYSGSGVKIGIGGESLIQASTVADYRTRFIGDSTQPTIVNVDGVTSTDNTGALDEAYLDVELSAGLAPGASMYFYTSKDLFTAIQTAVNDNTVDIFSLSFGNCELDLSTADNAMVAGWWQQAATEGMTVTVSTGDSGSAGCDATQDSQGNNITAAVDGLAVNGLGSTPYNISVGGTDLIGLSNSFSTYASTSEGSPSTFYRTALSYIPEQTWNDSTTLDTTISEDAAWSAASGSANIAAGSGGASSCSTNTTVDTSTTYTIGKCTSGYTKPVWQRGVNVPADRVRDLPDVALMAGNGFTPASWLVCSDDTTTNSSNATVTQNCTKQTDGNFYFVAFGGTSTATPAFAGILALVEQSTGGRLGQAAKNLYDLYNGSHASTIFHDTTLGNNSVPCTSGTPNCSLDTAGYDYLTGYNTTTGYDLATGLGSVDVSQLVTFWSSSTGTAAATFTVTPSATTLTSATAITVAVTLTGTAGTPTGDVTLTSGAYETPSEPLVGGVYTFSVPPGSLVVGTDTLTVAYSGDANYASSSGTATVTVTGLTPTVTVVPSATTFATNTAVNLAATVTGSGATPTGTVTLSGAATTTAQTLVGGAFTFPIPANTLSAGSLTFTVAYSGDSNYAPATGAVTVTVTASTATFSMTAGASTPASIAPGGTAVANVTVASPSGYTGTITFTCAQTAGPSNATADTPTCEFNPTLVFPATSNSVPFSVLTVAAVASSEVVSPKLGGDGSKGWTGAGGGAVLALLIFFGIPAKRRKWRSMLSMLIALVALGSLVACGGGGGGTKTPANPGSAAGTYTYTVSATGNPTPTSAPAAVTFTVVVN